MGNPSEWLDAHLMLGSISVWQRMTGDFFPSLIVGGFALGPTRSQ